MKLCPGCSGISVGWEEIRENYSPDASRGDGYRVYCRDCRKQRRKGGMGR